MARSIWRRRAQPWRFWHDDRLPVGTRLWIVAGITDMRRGFISLAGMVQTALEQNPFSGRCLCFAGGEGDPIKVLWSDGDRLCLFAKRL